MLQNQHSISQKFSLGQVGSYDRRKAEKLLTKSLFMNNVGYDSAEYRAVQGQLERSRKHATIRGLNKDYNHDLKDIFKGAAMRASTAAGPLHDFYENLLAKGRKPTMARLTLARKIAAITLIVWKKEVRLCAGINRHGVENERVLRERSSDPLGPEFCTGYREVHSEA